jgi:hypothetical protein
MKQLRNMENIKFFKPDLEEAEKRWQAFYAGELIDRPPVVITAPREGYALPPPISYHEKVFGDVEAVIQHGLAIAEATFWGGEAVPSFYPSIGPDEIAVFCGAGLCWSPDSPDTNWSVPPIDDWSAALPIRLKTEHPLFQRQQELYRRAAEIFNGRILLVAPDLHTNMDLLAALRGPQRLCLDLLDCPEWIDQAMVDARQVFHELWTAINSAGRMPEAGYCLESHGLFSRNGSATLQCDFSIMMSPPMFRRWVLPALEEEAEIVKHVVYHWDGPGALVHRKDLLTSRGLHTLSFVPGAGNGEPVEHVGLLRELQEAGKAVHVWGTPDECKQMHRALRPDRVFYCTSAATQSEAETLLDWFVENT